MLEWISLPFRTIDAWLGLDGRMPMVDRAFNKVRGELEEVGLLSDGRCLDDVGLEVTLLPSIRQEMGYVYEGHPGWLERRLGFDRGVIYLPSDVPHTPRQVGATLADVIRHEFAHMWHFRDKGFFRGSWFREAFGAAYADWSYVPWKACLDAHGLLFDVPSEDSLARIVRFTQDMVLRTHFVSEYGMTSACEDFAETFMFFLRYRHSLDRFRNRSGVFRKLRAVRRAVRAAARRHGLRPISALN